MNEAASDLGVVAILVVFAVALFWVGMLGLLWRRSLVGMLVGLVFAWVSVAVVSMAFGIAPVGAKHSATGGALVLCISALCTMQIAVGIGVVVARIKRRGTLDADDAGLLEG